MADTPELLRARAGGQLQNDVRNDEGGDSVILIYDSPFFLTWRRREGECGRHVSPTQGTGRTS